MMARVSLIAGAILALLYSAAAQSPDFLRTGFPLHALYNVDQRDAKVAMGHLLKEIVERHDVGYSTEIVEDHSEFLQNLTAGKYDFFLVFGYDYLRLRNTYPMRPIMVGQYADVSSLEKFVLLTSQDTKDLSELSNTNLLVAKGTGELPELWLNSWLASQSLPTSSEIFSEIQHIDNVSRAVLPVFFGKAKASVVPRSGFDLMVELNPQIGKRLRIHAESAPLLRSVLCLSPNYVEKEKGLVKREGLRLSDLPKGEQLITLLRMKKLVPFDPAYLENLEKLVEPASLADSSTEESAHDE